METSVTLQKYSKTPRTVGVDSCKFHIINIKPVH